MSISQLLAALAAKLSGLGLTAKAALGLGLAAATAASAGAVGVLPDAAQHAVATVVNAASPLDIPDPTGTVARAVTDPASGTTGARLPETGTPTPKGDDPAGTEDHGQPTGLHGACVSAVAKSAPTGAGGVHGEAVSAAAKACPKPADADETTTTTTKLTPAGGGSVSPTARDDDVERTGTSKGKGEGESGETGKTQGGSGPVGSGGHRK